MSMDDAYVNISELRRLGKPRNWSESLDNGAFGDTCDVN